jgi:hypothetical protein
LGLTFSFVAFGSVFVKVGLCKAKPVWQPSFLSHRFGHRAPEMIKMSKREVNWAFLKNIAIIKPY